MPLTLQTSITTARSILNDPVSGPAAPRYSNTDLLRYANDALDQIVTLTPQLFYARGTVTCISGVEQTLSFTNARALVVVERDQTGGAVTLTDSVILDLYDPNWRKAPAGPIKHWMRVGDDPLKFLVYPPSTSGQVLWVIYVRTPSEYAADADTGLPDTLSDAVADYIVYRAESRDDEYVNTNRATQFLNSFIAKVKGAT